MSAVCDPAAVGQNRQLLRVDCPTLCPGGGGMGPAAFAPWVGRGSFCAARAQALCAIIYQVVSRGTGFCSTRRLSAPWGAFAKGQRPAGSDLVAIVLCLNGISCCRTLFPPLPSSTFLCNTPNTSTDHGTSVRAPPVVQVLDTSKSHQPADTGATVGWYHDIYHEPWCLTFWELDAETKLRRQIRYFWEWFELTMAGSVHHKHHNDAALLACSLH